MPSNDPAQRIAELCAEILAANEAYATETPLMTRRRVRRADAPSSPHCSTPTRT